MGVLQLVNFKGYTLNGYNTVAETADKFSNKHSVYDIELLSVSLMILVQSLAEMQHINDEVDFVLRYLFSFCPICILHKILKFEVKIILISYISHY